MSFFSDTISAANNTHLSIKSIDNSQERTYSTALDRRVYPQSILDKVRKTSKVKGIITSITITYLK